MTKNGKGFSGPGEYNVSITAKNFEVTNPLRDYIEEKIGKIEKVTNQIIDVHVRLDMQKLNHFVDILFLFSHFKIKVGAITENMYSAIDKAFEKLYRKVKKWKSRIQDHHAKGVSVVDMQVNILERGKDIIKGIDEEIIDESNRLLEEEYTPPLVVKKKTRPLKTLTLDEAVMKLELSDDNFMIYRSEEEQNLKVIYRRRDGSYGIISPE